MRIYVSSPGERTVDLRFPSGLVLNSLTARIAAPIMSREMGRHIPAGALSAVIKEIERCRKSMPDWNLVEVSSPGNGDVIIKL